MQDSDIRKLIVELLAIEDWNRKFQPEPTSEYDIGRQRRRQEILEVLEARPLPTSAPTCQYLRGTENFSYE